MPPTQGDGLQGALMHSLTHLTWSWKICNERKGRFLWYQQPCSMHAASLWSHSAVVREMHCLNAVLV